MFVAPTAKGTDAEIVGLAKARFVGHGRNGGSLRGTRPGVVVGEDRFVMSHVAVNRERENDVQNSLSQVGWR